MNEYNRLPRNYTLLTDQYQISMSYSYFKSNIHETEAIFDVFFRKVPNNGKYAIMAGLDKIIPYVQNLKFDDESIYELQKYDYDEDFINYLKTLKFTGSITAIPEGTPVFPNTPILTVKAPLIQAQLLETSILSIINGAMEHATGARNIIEATPESVDVIEFGARRADGQEASIDSSIYGIMAGCSGSSNILASSLLGMQALGTQAHSYIESFDTELEAFLEYAKTYPNNCILLIDTYDTLKSGLPNAIKTFEYLKQNGNDLLNIGVRIDSGDLVYLSKQVRKMLDNAGFNTAKIILSNGLNSNSIKELVTNGAKFDVLGVGDNISKPNGRMGCVYKVSALKKDNNWLPKTKLSNDSLKISNPGYKTIYRAFDKNSGIAIADIIEINNNPVNLEKLEVISCNTHKIETLTNFNLTELQVPIFTNGKLVYHNPTMKEKQQYCNLQMSKLPIHIRNNDTDLEYNIYFTTHYSKFKNDVITTLMVNLT